MKKRSVVSYTLAGLLFFTAALPAVAADFPDMPSNWSTGALQNAVNNGLISGVPQGGKLYIKPNNTLKRAEMASIINKAFGSSKTAAMTGVADVKSTDWYYEHMAMSIQMESFARASLMRPNDNITREEAFTVLAKVFKLPDVSDYTALYAFNDAGNVSDYARSRIAALLESGYITGSGNRLYPKSNITRAEFAAAMDNIVKQYIYTPGTTTKIASGNIMINVPGVVLRDATVSGDLIIADGVGRGDVTLENVKVTGRLIVRGGGPNSIKITGTSTIGEMIIDNLNDQVRIQTASSAKIPTTTVYGEVILDGSFSDVTIVGEDAEVDLYGTVDYMSIKAPSYIFIDKNAVLKKVDIQQTAPGTRLSGEGRVENVTLKADGAQINTNRTKIMVAAGVKNASSGNSWLEAGTSFTSDSNASSQTPPKLSSSQITKVELNETGIAFSYGSTSNTSRKKLTATITPSNVPDKQVIWDITGSYASRYDLYETSGSSKLVTLGEPTDLLTVYVAPAVSSLSINHTATVTVTTVDGKKTDSCKITVSGTEVSDTPAANVTNAVKTANTQKSVSYTLTNSSTLKGSWRVFTSASGTTLATGIHCTNSGSTLTLSHATDIQPGTYYVAITEPDKTESDRLALTVSPYGTSYTITGKILGSANTGAAAEIRLLDSAGKEIGSAITAGADGKYTITGVLPGTYTIDVWMSGYVSGAIPVTVNNTNVSLADHQLKLRTYTINFHVTTTVDEESATPVAGAKVTLKSGNSTIEAKQTDSSGKCEFADLAQGTYSYEVELDGYKAVSDTVSTGANVTIELTANAPDLPPIDGEDEDEDEIE